MLKLLTTINLSLPKPPLEEIFLNSKYVQDGFSSKEIARLTFSSRSTVTTHLNKFGIPLNKITRRINGAHVFGFRKYGGTSIELKKEQEVIELINSYRISGYSYQRVANLLNDQGIETKMKKGFWYPKVIRQIHLRNNH